MKEDRRIRKTKSSIKKAFTTLLQNKDLDKITIRDITSEADVNRGTFYLHYEDKYMLLNDMEDECISELSHLTHFNHINGETVEEISQLFIENVLTKILQHIDDNLEFYHTILQLERTSKLEEKISELMKENMSRYMSINHEIDGIPEMYFHSYVAGATINTIKYWVLDPHRISVEELTHHIYKIVFNGPLRIMAEYKYQKNHA
ncbi:TetR/AcrR family transcriptional regulator [Staphylococcus caprae]|uniref:TetR/AcrR family transcriptional regulator n=1 Tax=Staphylococcus caprae TaxID=29380 RepID=UPI000E6A6DF1|nr:TetR/AcrR family transcriptional regulator [Staphylococcus caprae]MBU5272210.1 TetR/AcrR family transcriptional regulator [Staphylococcus caprae]RIM33764.1 TetR/AcrR family transcriptional regulator [Staphylococcus caprae]